MNQVAGVLKAFIIHQAVAESHDRERGDVSFSWIS